MKFTITFFFLFIINIFFPQELKTYEDTLDIYRQRIQNIISKENLKEFVHVLASDSLKGRDAYTEGLDKAKNYILNSLRGKKFRMKFNDEDFLQIFDIESKLYYNIIVKIPGKSLKDEVIVISAHYDHVGMEGKKIFNGADDNASGVAAVLELLRVYLVAYNKGWQPERSLVFAFFSAEELGLWGSHTFMHMTQDISESFYANVNIDMIGRVDRPHKKNPNYLYTVGSDYFSESLDSLMFAVNDKTLKLELNKRYNDVDHSEKFHQRTDSFPFALEGVPFIFFTSGLHSDYHTPTDTYEKINYEQLQLRTQFIFSVIWELGNRMESLNVDKTKVNLYKWKFGNN